MERYENDCVSCGADNCCLCRLKSVRHLYCDECGEEDDLFYFDGRELCIDCIKGSLDPVE